MLNTDIFREMKYFLSFCKIVGILCFDISGPPNRREFLYTQKNFILFTLKFSLVQIIFIFGVTNKWKFVFSELKLWFIPDIFIISFYLLLSYIFFYYQMFQQEKIVNFFYKLQELVNLLRKCEVNVNYKIIKKCFYLLFSVETFFIIPFTCDFYVYPSPIVTIFYGLSEFLSILVLTLFCLILITVTNLVRGLNELMKSSRCGLRAFHLHFEIFELCKWINRLNSYYLTLRILVGFSSIVYTMFMLQSDVTVNYGLEVFDNICWFIHHWFYLLIVIAACTSTRNEVNI